MEKSKFGVGMQWMAAALVISMGVPSVTAGNQGAYMNSLGYGKAASNVGYNGVLSSVLSPAQYYPCAAVNPLSTFSCVSPAGQLPAGAPTSVYCQAKGGPNYQWKIQSYVTGGATADNTAIDARITVVPAPCASYEMESSATFFDANSGTISVNATATAGAALWLRGIEYLGPNGTPTDLEDLLANGALKWDVLLVGPFNLNQADCTSLTLPFSTTTGHQNLYFVTDAVAKSVPLGITCGGDVTFGCADPVVYPAAQTTGGCGNVSVSYSPLPSQLPAGVSTVTATATDEAGNTAQCSFNVTRAALGFDGFYAPLNGTGGTCATPLRSFNVGSVIPVKFSTTCEGSTFLGGSPTLSIAKCPTSQVIASGNFQAVANEWHFNWNTAGLAKGVYQLVATLQDGSQKTVFVRLR